MHILNKYKSVNFDDRAPGSKIEYVILHYAETDFVESIRLLCTPEGGVSAHYIIHKDSDIYSLVDDLKRAWHAGKSYWRGNSELNHNSIGIEIDNNGYEDFNKDQMLSCIGLCKYLMQKYSIPKENVIGHSDIAPNRKVDPGPLFNWPLLAMNNIGMWPKNISNKDVKLSNILTRQRNLQKLGYKIELTGELDLQTIQVIKAFQAHFNPISLVSLDQYKKLDSLEINWQKEDEIILTQLL